jgi:hypothetical protein
MKMMIIVSRKIGQMNFNISINIDTNGFCLLFFVFINLHILFIFSIIKRNYNVIIIYIYNNDYYFYLLLFIILT